MRLFFCVWISLLALLYVLKIQLEFELKPRKLSIGFLFLIGYSCFIFARSPIDEIIGSSPVHSLDGCDSPNLNRLLMQ